MYDWEQDPDTWKGESKKYNPEKGEIWKEGNEAEIKKDPKVARAILAYTVGIRPMVTTTLVEDTDDILVDDRDALKLVSMFADGQKATTKDGELFKYSSQRNMWIRIPWEKP